MKTHLLTKKRALISSVAMLLVAIIALGTATFAWFTKSTEATASGIGIETSKISSLVVSKLDKSWTDKVTYAKTGQIVKPTSSSDLKNWFSAEAKTGEAYGMKENTEAEDVTGKLVNEDGSINYVFAEQLNVKNAGGVTINDVKIRFKLQNTIETSSVAPNPVSDGRYLRLAIVPVTDKDTNKSLLPSNFDVKKATIYGLEDETWYPIDSKTKKPSATELTATSALATTEFNVDTLNAGQAKYYNIYVWYEGQDEDCFNYTAGAKLPDITFTVVGTPANAEG